MRLRRPTVWRREGCEVSPDPHGDDVVRPHLQREEEVRVVRLGHDLLQRARAHVMRKPVLVKPATEAVRLILLPVPQRLQVLEGQIGDAVGGLVFRRLWVSIGAEAEFAVKDG